MPDLGGGRHRALAAAARQALLDRHRGRDAVDRVDLGRARRLHDAARIGVERFEVAPLALVEQDVEGERALARARHAGDHAELAARDVDVERLQVVLARVDDADRLVLATRGGSSRASDRALQRAAFLDRVASMPSALVVGERRAGVRAGAAPRPRAVPSRPPAPPASPPSGPEVDQPVRGADHVEVVLDHDQRVAGIQQLAEARASAWRCRRSAGRWSARRTGTACPSSPAAAAVPRLRRLGQEAGELQALRLAARQRGHRLAELHVLEADVDDRLQHAQHLAVLGEQLHRLADGQLEHVATLTGRRPARPPRSIFTSRISGGSAGRRSRGSAGRRRTGTASRRARSPSRRRSGSARRRR